MKVVLTTHQFLPEFSAGTEVLTYETAMELKSRGLDVEVWTGFPADPETAKQRPIESYRHTGLQVHRYNHSFNIPLVIQNVMEYEYNNLLFVEHFRDYLKKAKPDLVHFFHLFRFSASIIDACAEEKIPMLFTPTDFWVLCPTSQLRLPDNQLCVGPDPYGINCIRHIAYNSTGLESVRRFPDWLFRFIIRGAKKRWWPEKRYSPILRAMSERKAFFIGRLDKLDRVLVPTRFMEKMLIRNGYGSGTFKFLPFGLNLKPFERIGDKVRKDRIRLGFIGSLLEHKGAHVLLAAMTCLPKDMPFDLKVYGKLDDDKNYTAKLRELAGSDGRVEFCGSFPNEKIGEVFSGIDVLVVPSIWYENTPLVIYSAHAAGTPVIATNLGGMSEIVHHEVNGLLFEKGDAKGLSALIKRVVDDSGLLDRLASNITPPVSISDYAAEIVREYEDVLSKRRKK